ncbi:MAG: hypothetical protein J6Z40_06890 [Oscillospiraceae bacterium]|nr:hypothetical protein [Oscillospiraceae bacterium]
MIMKKIGLQMGLLMGVTLSFCLSLYGNLHSGHFTLPSFLISFLISCAISFIIGFVVPMPKLEEGICRKLGVNQRSLGGNALTSLMSDLIYTPLITLAMTALAFKQASAHGAAIPFMGMFIGSVLISLLIGFVLIFLLKPLFLKLVLKLNGIAPVERPQDE